VHLNLLNSELAVPRTVARELASEDGKADLDFVEICPSDLNEHVLGIHGDLGGIRVDDGWKRKDSASSIIEDGILCLIFNNVKILL